MDKVTKTYIIISIAFLVVATAVFFCRQNNGGEKIMNNKWLVIGALISLVLIYFMGRSWGKNTPPPAVSVDGLVDTDGNLVSNMTDSDIDFLTSRAYSDLEGINYWFVTNHETELWNQIAALSDYDLTRVINSWNSDYYQKHKESLYDAINSDNWAFDLSAGAITVLLRKIKRIENL